MVELIGRLLITPLKIIKNDKGNILHALKNNSKGYEGFGEAYFSQINKHEIKGWKKHNFATLNLIVPIGKIRFVFYESNHKFFEITLDKIDNYSRITVPPGLWFAFEGIYDENLLLNIIPSIHDPNESETKDLEEIPYPIIKNE